MLQLPAYVEGLQKEVRLLRIHNQQLRRSRTISAGKISELDDEIKRLKQENKELEKEEKRLEKEQERLKREIEKISKTNSRYQIALFDHGNFKHTERELRNMAIKRTISNGSDTYKGMENTAIIASVIQTLQRGREVPFLSTLQAYFKSGIQEKYGQYIHTAFYDS